MIVRDILKTITLRSTQQVEVVDYENREIYRTSFGHGFPLTKDGTEPVLEREVKMMYFTSSTMTLILKEVRT